MKDDAKEILEHHGVRGQKWGVRRSQKALRSARAQRKQEGSSEAKSGKDVKSVKKGKTRYSTKASKLSTEELKSRISRMETEKRYNDLNRRDKGALEAMATSALKQAGTQVLQNQLVQAGNIGAEAAKSGLKAKSKAQKAKRKTKNKNE